MVTVAVACVVLLGLGGAALDRAFPGPSGGASPAPSETTIGYYPPPFDVAPAASGGGGAAATELPTSRAALMGLQSLRVEPAPGFTLVDQDGRHLSLAGLRGKVVVLSFFDSACDDICGVLETELSGAFERLGAHAGRVAFVAVNTDPLQLRVAPDGPASTRALLSGLPLQFVTGSLAHLSSVWTSYGVEVEVQTSTRTASHNDVMYFIDPSGRVRFRATPFADQTRSGVFSLSRGTEEDWARAIADEADFLLGGKP
jgi:cytochrome oxidase Cu insertion factor (SCO1/SenC/PrrC family)